MIWAQEESSDEGSVASETVEEHKKLSQNNIDEGPKDVRHPRDRIDHGSNDVRIRMQQMQINEVYCCLFLA